MITGAIESCFSFEGLDTDNYIFDSELPPQIDYTKALKKAKEIEKNLGALLGFR